MPSEETPADSGGGLLAGLRAPFRLPERLIEALVSLAESAGDVGPIRAEITRVRKHTEPLGELIPSLEGILAHTEPVAKLPPLLETVVSQTEPLDQLIPALERLESGLYERLEALESVVGKLESKDSFLNKTVRDLVGEVADVRQGVLGLRGDLERITDRLPDPERGPLQKAREVLTGGTD